MLSEGNEKVYFYEFAEQVQIEKFKCTNIGCAIGYYIIEIERQMQQFKFDNTTKTGFAERIP